MYDKLYPGGASPATLLASSVSPAFLCEDEDQGLVPASVLIETRRLQGWPAETTLEYIDSLVEYGLITKESINGLVYLRVKGDAQSVSPRFSPLSISKKKSGKKGGRK